MHFLSSKPMARLAAIFATGLMLVMVPVAQAEWLNRILTTVSTIGGTTIFSFLSSADDQNVAFSGDVDINDQFELYSVPIAGGAVKKLSGAMVNGGDVGTTYFLPTDRLIYQADQVIDDQIELFSVPYSGGPATRLNGNLIAGGDVQSWSLSDDFSEVVYAADQETDEVVELYHVPLSGGVASKVNEPLAPGDSVKKWAFSSALAEVVYATQFSSSPGPQVDLYRIPVAGGAVVTLTLPITTGETLISVGYSPNGDRLLYQAGFFPYGRLYSIGLDGTDAQPLSSGSVIPNWGYSQDGQQVLYSLGSPLALYTVSITGGLPTKLSANGGGDIIEWKLSPDGNRVIYWAYLSGSSGSTGLYSVALTGGPVVPLHSAPVQIYSRSHFQVTPDSTQVVYLGESYRLYIVSILGGTPTPLTGSTAAYFLINASGSAVIFLDDIDTVGTVELYSIPLTGGTPDKLNRPLIANENVAGFSPTRDGQAIIYKVTGASYVELDVAYQPSQLYLPMIIR